MMKLEARLEMAELDDKLKTQELSQEVIVMRDGAWVFLYNEVDGFSALSAEVKHDKYLTKADRNPKKERRDRTWR